MLAAVARVGGFAAAGNGAVVVGAGMVVVVVVATPGTVESVAPGFPPAITSVTGTGPAETTDGVVVVTDGVTVGVVGVVGVVAGTVAGPVRAGAVFATTTRVGAVLRVTGFAGFVDLLAVFVGLPVGPVVELVIDFGFVVDTVRTGRRVAAFADAPRSGTQAATSATAAATRQATPTRGKFRMGDTLGRKNSGDFRDA